MRFAKKKTKTRFSFKFIAHVASIQRIMYDEQMQLYNT